MATIGSLIEDAERGDTSAANELFALLYRELHDLAEHHLRTTAGEITLGTTTLLHETYLKLTQRGDPRFPDRGRFLAYASKAMRGLVIDFLRARRALKRGGEFEITRIGDRELEGEAPPDAERAEQLAGALEELGRLDPGLAQLVDLHFFCGLSFVEIAALRNLSERTVQRDWQKARLVLQRLAQ